MRLLHLPGVHRPRSDTSLLLEVLGGRSLRGLAVADVCTGSGVLAIAAALRGASRVLAVDVSVRALLATRVNALLNRCSLRTRRGDLLRALGAERFDLILCNPPYVPAATDALPRHRVSTALDAGRDGRVLLDRLCCEASRHLREAGSLLLVQSSLCGVERTCELLAEHELRAEVLARRRGPLGPVLAARAPMLRARGLLGDADEEELAVIAAFARGPHGHVARAAYARAPSRVERDTTG